jgi:hypothetical protein
VDRNDIRKGTVHCAPTQVGAGAPTYPNVRNVLGMITSPASKITDE